MNSAETLLQALQGKWKGTCQTWFEPGKLADESPIEGEFSSVLDGRFVRHVYSSSIQGKPRRGEELIAFNKITGQVQVNWVDDFHMNYALMFSEGPPEDGGFSVLGHYDVGPDQPRWGWRTVFQKPDADQLIITSYNVDPEGREAKAVEVRYRRVR